MTQKKPKQQRGFKSYWQETSKLTVCIKQTGVEDAKTSQSDDFATGPVVEMVDRYLLDSMPPCTIEIEQLTFTFSRLLYNLVAIRIQIWLTRCICVDSEGRSRVKFKLLLILWFQLTGTIPEAIVFGFFLLTLAEYQLLTQGCQEGRHRTSILLMSHISGTYTASLI